MRRERQYKVRIGELESQLHDFRSKKAKESDIDSTMDKLRQMHRSIINSVGQVQDRTSKVLQGAHHFNQRTGSSLYTLY